MNHMITIVPTWGRRMIIRLTTNHAASSYGRPVAVSRKNEPFTPVDLAGSTVVKGTPEAIEAFKRAGYEFNVDLKSPVEYAKTWKLTADDIARLNSLKRPRESNVGCVRRLIREAYADTLMDVH